MQAFIILSCLIAVSVNFSTFLVIGKTSPVTYQVLGHLKTCLVLGFGYTLLHDPFTSRNIIGILIAILGMVLYSYFCTHENKKKQLGDLSAASQVPLSPSHISVLYQSELHFTRFSLQPLIFRFGQVDNCRQVLFMLYLDQRFVREKKKRTNSFERLDST